MDAYPLLRVDHALDVQKDANLHSHRDLASCFLQVRVLGKDTHETTFQTPYDLMEWVAMPLG
jgi:hypothetical protein